ncbi:MAG TPA: helix-turn-helix domain-containing protein [Burkholderiaceae bacterium]|nr:helix-turn-helix domain-containing protein [Burkholderiaceae bacterium]
MDQSVFRHLHGPQCGIACSSCNLREICLPSGLTRVELEYIDRRLVSSRRKVARGAALFRTGDPFQALYAVWTGQFKTCLTSQAGREQVTGFHLSGELVGLDGMDTRRHQVDAVALEDSQVCVLLYEEFEALTREVASLHQRFNQLVSRELVGHQGVMLMLGSMYADERMAAFLLNLAHRLDARGFSPTAVTLRMTREEIASFLGLSIETISRTFSKFQARGLLFVHNRQIRITDPLGMRHILDGDADLTDRKLRPIAGPDISESPET